MPLQWQKIEVPMGFGIDETAHRFIQSPPGLAILQNGRIDKDGQINFRPGYKARAQAPGQVYWMFGYNASLYAAYQESSATTDTVCQALACLNADGARFDKQGGFVATNALTEATILERLAVARDTTYSIGDYNGLGTVTGMQGIDFTIDESTKQTVIAWVQQQDSSGGTGKTRIYATVLDTETRAVVRAAQIVSTGMAAAANITKVKVIKEGTTVHVVYDDPTTGTIRCRDYDLSTKAWGADTQLVANLNLIGAWDAAEGGANFWVLAYRDTTPRLHTCLMVGAAVSSSAVLAEDPMSIAVLINGSFLPAGIIWVVYHRNATDLRAIAYDLTFAVTAGPATIEAVATLACTIGIVEVSAGTKLLICWTTLGTATTRTTSKYRTWTTAGVLGTQCNRYSLRLASKPVFYGSVCYANYLYAGLGDTSPVLLTMAVTGVAGCSSGVQMVSYRTCAVWMQGFAGYIPQDPATPLGASPPTLRAFDIFGEFWFPALERGTIRNETIFGRSTPHIFGKNGLDLCRMNLSSQDVRRPAEIGGNVIIPGGKTQLFDGQGVIDHGMWYPPEDVIGTVAAGGGTSTGDYQIALVWKYETEHGVLRSPPIFAIDSVTGDPLFNSAAGGDKITLSIPPLNVTQMFNALSGGFQRANAVQAEIYRTEANGSVLYLEEALSVTNDVFEGSTHLSAVCTAADSALKDNAELYTTGDILSAWPLPACDCFVVYKNRVYGISSEDKKQIVFTQFLQDGEVPQWHPFLAFRLDDDGPCTGLAVMDDNLIVFKEDAVYIMRGNGPDRKGLNQDYIISKVQSPHGCIDRRSILVDPRGVTFRARLGLMLLNRQLQVQYFGVKVEDIMSADQSVLDCAALPNYTERLYFLLDNGDNNSLFLVYQWNNDQWAIDAVAGDEQAPMLPLCIAWIDGTAYVAFANDLNVYAHELDEDPNDVYQLGIISNWFEFAGPQGFKRIRAIEFLGEYKRHHDISLYLFRDYEEQTPFQTVTFLDAETALWLPYQFKIHVSEQRCESLRYLLTVTPNQPDSLHSDAVTLVAQAFDVGIKPTLKRMPDAQMRG
jgi:hypothetical protein